MRPRFERKSLTGERTRSVAWVKRFRGTGAWKSGQGQKVTPRCGSRGSPTATKTVQAGSSYGRKTILKETRG